MNARIVDVEALAHVPARAADICATYRRVEHVVLLPESVALAASSDNDLADSTGGIAAGAGAAALLAVDLLVGRHQEGHIEVSKHPIVLAVVIQIGAGDVLWVSAGPDHLCRTCGSIDERDQLNSLVHL